MAIYIFSIVYVAVSTLALTYFLWDASKGKQRYVVWRKDADHVLQREQALHDRERRKLQAEIKRLERERAYAYDQGVQSGRFLAESESKQAISELRKRVQLLERYVPPAVLPMLERANGKAQPAAAPEEPEWLQQAFRQ